MYRPHFLRLLLWCPVLLLAGCVFYPREIEYYDEGCDIRARRLVLESEPLQQNCSGNLSTDPEGKGCLAFVLAMSAGSAIVSGSIVVVGNTVYWLEKEGRCVARGGASS